MTENYITIHTQVGPGGTGKIIFKHVQMVEIAKKNLQYVYALKIIFYDLLYRS